MSAQTEPKPESDELKDKSPSSLSSDVEKSGGSDSGSDSDEGELDTDDTSSLTSDEEPSSSSVPSTSSSRPRGGRTCLSFLWSIIRRVLGIMFYAYVLSNNLESVMFHSPTQQVVRGHDFLRISSCSLTRAPMRSLLAAVKTDYPTVAQTVQRDYNAICPPSWVQKSVTQLGGETNTHRLRVCGVLLTFFLPLFSVYSWGAIPSVLVLLFMRASLLTKDQLQTGFFSLLSFCGLNGFTYVMNRMNGGRLSLGV